MLLSIGRLGINFGEILIKWEIFSQSSIKMKNIFILENSFIIATCKNEDNSVSTSMFWYNITYSSTQSKWERSSNFTRVEYLHLVAQPFLAGEQSGCLIWMVCRYSPCYKRKALYLPTDGHILVRGQYVNCGFDGDGVEWRTPPQTGHAPAPLGLG